jgi:hypothetical protein
MPKRVASLGKTASLLRDFRQSLIAKFTAIAADGGA